MDSANDIPLGLCQCGCGQRTPLARQTSKALGRVKGQPIRFINGHQGNGRQPVPLMERLWAKIDVRGRDECWPFTGHLSKGYGRIGLGRREDGIGHAHRIVAESVYGPCPEGLETRHLCGNRACCNPAHLRFGTPSENQSDKLAHGTSNRGERHGMHKLTPSQVREIRRCCEAGELQRNVAVRFGIAQQSVSEIVTGKTWGWLS